MANTLKTIQIFSKVGKIISKVIFILCVVFGAICLVAVFSALTGIGAGEIFKIGGMSVVGLIGNETGRNIEEISADMISGLFALASNAVLAKFYEKYFVNELASGTPFTFEGAKEMLRLGILTIAVPIASIVSSEIILAVLKNFWGVAENSELRADVSVSLGIALIALSFVFKYGAELIENNNKPEITEEK